MVHPSWVEAQQAKEIIGDIVKRRRPIHQAYRWRWALAIPLSAPFSLVPGTYRLNDMLTISAS